VLVGTKLPSTVPLGFRRRSARGMPLMEVNHADDKTIIVCTASDRRCGYAVPVFKKVVSSERRIQAGKAARAVSR